MWTLRTCSRYLKGPSNLVLCVSEKNFDYTTHQSDYTQGNVTRVGISKNEAQMSLEYSNKS